MNRSSKPSRPRDGRTLKIRRIVNEMNELRAELKRIPYASMGGFEGSGVRTRLATLRREWLHQVCGVSDS